MKRCYIDIQKLGYNPNFHAILQIAGIIEVDNNILETFTIKCKPFFYDQGMVGALLQEDINLEKILYDEEYLNPKIAFKRLKYYLDKYLDVNEGKNKFQFVEFSDSEHTFKFIHAFFEKNNDSSFKDYFWIPCLDLLYISNFILEMDRVKLKNLKLSTVANYFGFKVESEHINKPFYKVDLIRNLYHILEKFRIQKVYVKKANIN